MILDFELGRFDVMGDKLQNILISFLSDEELLKLTQPEYLLPDDPYSLIDTQLYTQLYMPPNDTASIIICVFYSSVRPESGSSFYKNFNINVAIIIHRDLWKINGKLRAFSIADRIDRILNRNNITESLSKDMWTGMDYSMNSIYNVIQLTYRSWD